ncbi:ATP synthase gamma chain [Candidatus Saccharimonas aalborgensis]|jgi:F-type H+-transporting ATPase subunit gamma|uniref:ATP synthase gamma chain n=1 Tax=Candidatus Saccharimonas aalborgensis TaxID=1332188 RepID=R4PV87_9BACT|nr:F0F1 ATP synthase subunit gamma [Candidatus Saccharimonas aalborgensis]MBP7775087.1 F0F1 ATP synthase subunit gamma [Candidatus Saccharimonas sp.]QQR50896.1 MAG: F0F1 ATP synthase subunit gamma [Candidatus Saccharibacteria bacterium]AGL62125.1 ATP synthase gamma chain [Candidatus Saccharimonas aalborgensis]QQS68638.1 MAG: F0F1 ATP synthase subunit gamma [Candidatus Saccharibacteria bacterium]QQS70938.1 MAG: F0F1 ATP synthase subunit gamma [Candidatus Saccharibacteria bacterium]
MRRANVVEKDMAGIGTLKDLTNVFESLASTQVAKVKNKAQLSQQFFNLLWKRYTAIRVDPKKRITSRSDSDNGRKVLILISAEAGLSGDLDMRMIETMQQEYDRGSTDIIVLGSHGANQLTQRGIPYVRFFQVPESDSYINVSPIIEAIRPYHEIAVYYEEYLSLGQQEVRRIDLISHMKDMSEDAEEGIMTDLDTIFEPSLDEIADQMESTMMSLALSQTILQSGLAQAASRFNAMTVAEDRASELLGEYKLEYHRAKRSESDRRLREVLVSIKKKRREAQGGRR